MSLGFFFDGVESGGVTRDMLGSFQHVVAQNDVINNNKNRRQDNDLYAFLNDS